jgi:hypothetical protein
LDTNTVQTTQLAIAPTQLLLDPNNYRFHDLAGYKPVSQRSRYAEHGVQDRAMQLLQTTDAFELDALRDSILSNGFIPIEQIVVERFDDSEPARYVVLEGNRRVAAIKSLLADHAAGAADVPHQVLRTLQELPIIEIKGTPEERGKYQKTLMAIRHVAGIREWGPYQQAKLVVELFEGELHAFGPVAQGCAGCLQDRERLRAAARLQNP